jgi:hypothetical protein
MTKSEVRIGNFLIERAKDFDGKTGGMRDGRGWFASKITGNVIHSGIWFETYEAAEAAVREAA